MTTKKCSSCKIIKKLTDFYLRNKYKNWHQSKCKECVAKFNREKYYNDFDYREKCKEKGRNRFKEKYYNDKEFRESRKQKSKKYRKENAECKKIKDKEYRQRPEVKEKINKRKREIYANKGLTDKRKKYCKNYMKTYNKKYSKDPKNKLKIKTYRKSKKYKEKRKRHYEKNKNKIDYRIRRNMSKNIWKSIKGVKTKSWLKLVDYSLTELISHIESKFQKGMNWQNYGEWHVDHKRPVSSFNITSQECDDFKLCWSLENLQPLWAIDNLKKGSKYSQNILSKFADQNPMD